MAGSLRLFDATTFEVQQFDGSTLYNKNPQGYLCPKICMDDHTRYVFLQRLYK